MAGFQPEYLSTNRGVTKLIQIILGIVISSILCGNWYGGTSCFGEGRMGYVSGLNAVFLLANVVLLILNLLSIRFPKVEQFYNILGTVLFLIAIILFAWFLIQYGDWGFWRIVTGICIVILFLLFQWDFRGNRMSNDHLELP